MFVSTTNIRVRYAETDQMGFVYYGNYAQYFEVGRAESVRQIGYTYKDMEADGVYMPVVAYEANYLRAARYDDLLTVKTTLQKLPTDHQIIFHCQVLNENQKLLTTGKVTLFFMDAKTNKKTTMPAALLEKLQSFFQ
jgi:acyl-CoA thioester hydrolase